MCTEVTQWTALYPFAPLASFIRCPPGLFTIREIKGLLDNADENFKEVLNRKIIECDRLLLTTRERSRLLHIIREELKSKPSESLRAADLLSELVYLWNEKFERMVTMVEEGRYHVLVGQGLIPMVEEGGIADKIKALRAELEADGGSLPMIRIMDELAFQERTLRIIWGGDTVQTLSYPPEDAPGVIADKVVEELRKLAALEPR
ncbi:MAG: hypothetical protein LBS19_15410 [Clostridiales bacterium]|jgi:flagellar biosynthesis component FlhA|nr:hypothetical protein [Clostridiales bacterium]